MKVWLRDLPPDTMFQLDRIVREKGLGASAFCHPIRRTWLAVMGAVSLGVGLLSAWILLSKEPLGLRPLEVPLPWVGLLGLVYGPVALVEYLRVLGAGLKPFLLLTPFNLVRCLGSHRPLELYRLAEASAFQRVEEDDGAKWKGQAYAFTFDGGHKVNFTLNRKQDVAAANVTLDLARSVASGERLPAGAPPLGDLQPSHLQGLPKETTVQQLLNPTSELWLLALGLLCIGFVLWVLLRIFIR